jgi:hypothetical protein
MRLASSGSAAGSTSSRARSSIDWARSRLPSMLAASAASRKHLRVPHAGELDGVGNLVPQLEHTPQVCARLGGGQSRRERGPRASTSERGRQPVGGDPVVGDLGGLVHRGPGAGVGEARLHGGGQAGVHPGPLPRQQVVVRGLAQQLVAELEAAPAQHEDVVVDGLAGRGLDVLDRLFEHAREHGCVDPRAARRRQRSIRAVDAGRASMRASSRSASRGGIWAASAPAATSSSANSGLPRCARGPHRRAPGRPACRAARRAAPPGRRGRAEAGRSARTAVERSSSVRMGRSGCRRCRSSERYDRSRQTGPRTCSARWTPGPGWTRRPSGCPRARGARVPWSRGARARRAAARAAGRAGWPARRRRRGARTAPCPTRRAAPGPSTAPAERLDDGRERDARLDREARPTEHLEAERAGQVERRPRRTRSCRRRHRR